MTAPPRDTRVVALTVVIATRDRYPQLRRAIAAVERQTLDDDRFELIVVDNSSDRAAQADFVRDLSVACRCDYAIEERAGAARARNIGTRLAQGEIVAFLDDDTEADPGWAEAILHRFTATPGIGALGGPVFPVWPGERPVWLPAWGDAILAALDHGPEPHALARDEWLVSANLAFRKAVLEAAGGFPEALGRRGAALLSNEDLAVVAAVAEAGHPAFYEPRMSVLHHVDPSRLSQDWLRRRMAWQLVSDFLQADGQLSDDEPADLATLGRLLGDGSRPGTLADLFTAHVDAEAVTTQMDAVRLLMRLLLSRDAWVVPRNSASFPSEGEQDGVGRPTPSCLEQIPIKSDHLIG